MKEKFQRWYRINEQVEKAFSEIDFFSIKNLRKEQRKIEDSIYKNVLENKSEDLKNFLPKTCDSLEAGLNVKNNIFYFLMIDPDYEELKLLAITIDLSKNVKIIRDFEM